MCGKRCVDNETERREFLDLLQRCDTLEELHLTLTPFDFAWHEFGRDHESSAVLLMEDYMDEMQLIKIAISSHPSINHIIIDRWADNDSCDGVWLTKSIFHAISRNNRIKNVTINPSCCIRHNKLNRNEYSLERLGMSLRERRKPLDRLSLISFDLGLEFYHFFRSFASHHVKLPQIIHLDKCFLCIPDCVELIAVLESKWCSIQKLNLARCSGSLYRPKGDPEWDVVDSDGQILNHYPLITRLAHSLKKNASVSTLGLVFSVDIYRTLVDELFRGDSAECVYNANRHLSAIIWQSPLNRERMCSEYCNKFFEDVTNNGVDERGGENQQPDLMELLPQEDKCHLFCGDHKRIMDYHLTRNKHNNKRYVARSKVLDVINTNLKEGVLRTTPAKILFVHVDNFLLKAYWADAIGPRKEYENQKINFYYHLTRMSDLILNITPRRRSKRLNKKRY